MTLIPGRRAAEELAGVLDGSRPELADRYADLTACVELLERHDPVVPRPEFVADLRSRLMDAADTLLDAESPPVIPLPAPGRDRPSRGARERRLGAVAIAFVLVGGSAGVAAAAGGSLPGDTLYPVKRTLESARVTLNPSTTGKGSGLLGQADTRLEEIDSLVAEDRTDRLERELIDQTLADFETSATKGADLLIGAYQRDSDAADLNKLRDFAAAGMDRLQTISEQAPASSQDAFASAAEVLADIDRQVSTLCAACGGSLLEIPHELLSSAAALGGLLETPASPAKEKEARDKAVEDAPAAASDLADAAQSVADSLPRIPAPLAPAIAARSPVEGSGGAATGGSAKAGGGESDGDQPAGPIKKTTNAVTNGVGQTLGLVDGITGGMTAPLTGLVTSTVDSLLDTILGPGASDASGGQSGTTGK